MGISKQGDGYLRRLLVVGAAAVLRYARQSTEAKVFGNAASREEAPESRRGHAGQQDGADRVGASAPQRDLRGADGTKRRKSRHKQTCMDAERR